ncbi:MAG TPA: GSCFA domain-containing protein [Rhizomicrobium sp.]|jgi:hypothetical protein|nr:GSCFA domain-containing protein [Rhizomicrobium sp.]
MKIYVAGNCQASVMTHLLGAATGLPAETLSRKTVLDPERIIFAQMHCRSWLQEEAIWFPRISTPGFHPDIVHGREYENTPSPMRGYSSSIVLKAWSEGVPVHAALALFNADVFERLGFFDYFEAGKLQLLEEGREAGIPLEDHLERWLADGCFMHTSNHPKVRVMVDIAHALLAKTDLDWKPLENPVDRRAGGCGWPVYPEIAARIGVEGSYAFRMHSLDGARILDLKEFVEQCFEMYAREKMPRVASTERLASPRYANIRSLLPAQFRGRHPYIGLPERQYWRKSVRGDVDPVTASFTITPEMRIATAGSCFAQHISAALAANGFNYFVTETDPGTGGSNYGVFSARYGNIYTARQLLQLFQRAYGSWSPRTRTWRLGKRFVDPFRPEIEPDGFENAAAMYEARKVHFEAVRRMFEELDVFVFTLGLTEAWRAKGNGAVFPLAPGVTGGTFNPAQYEFVNFGVSEVVDDLRNFLGGLSRVNPRARVILTVSPVPLIATYEPRHVLVSTTYSKSVLRVAAEEVARSKRNVTYFPSYEIITGGFNRGRYFAPDLRTVTPAGVEHVMRMFFRHFSPDATIAASVKETMDVVCEEESLVRPAQPAKAAQGGPAARARAAAARPRHAAAPAPVVAPAPAAVVAPVPAPVAAPTWHPQPRRSWGATFLAALKRIGAKVSVRRASYPNGSGSGFVSRPD